MKREQDINEESMRENKWRRARRRQNRIKLVMVMLCTLVVLVVIMYCGTALYLKITEKNAEDGAVEVLGGTVVYTQEELDQQVARAVSDAEARALEAESLAATRIEEAVRNAEEQAHQGVLNTIRTGLSDGQTMLETLRPLFPEELLWQAADSITLYRSTGG